MATGRQSSMPNNPNRPFLSKESILLLGDGFCFCAPGQKKYYPFSDFTGNLEENLASFVQQKSLSDQVQWIVMNVPTAVIPSLNYEEELQNSYWESFSVKTTDPLKSHISSNGLIRFVYPYPKKLADILTNPIVIPSFALLYDRIMEQPQSNFNTQIYVHLYTHHFDLFITQGTRLLMSNSYSQQNEEDFMYYLFYAAEQLKISENNSTLYFLGKFEQYTSYYEGTRNFQKDIQFIDAHQGNELDVNDPVPFWNA